MYLFRCFRMKKLYCILKILLVLVIVLISGVFHHIFEVDFDLYFRYPYDGNIEEYILTLKQNGTPSVSPINLYNFYYYKNCDKKCKDISDLRLIFIVKSAPNHFSSRLAIRSSWGFERRFSDVAIKTVFLVGMFKDPQLQTSLNDESQKFGDIVQANYTDIYFNNTYKSMSGIYWAMKYCSEAKFYMIVDDDYYVSTKNVLRFIKFPTHYPSYLKEPIGNIRSLIGQRKPLELLDFELDNDVRLYAGYGFQSSPLRFYFSKWYISLTEYPYHKWPPYITGGAMILSNSALKDLYYTSMFTKHFKFDDIYISILAYKAKIEPFHSEEFNFYKKPYYRMNYKYTVASHGYKDTEELMKVWNEQKSLGNA